jgi:hypothetical protein
MNDIHEEVVPGLTYADIEEMAGKVLERTDENHPQMSSVENGFMGILKNGKSELSSSPIFIRKINP